MADILTEITEGKPIRYAVTMPEGWTSCRSPSGSTATRNLTGEIAGPARRRLDPARQLRLCPRRHPPVGARKDAGGDDHRAGRSLGRPRGRPADRDARGAGDPGLDRREGNRRRHRAPAGRRGVHQPAARRHAPAVRPDHHLRHHQGPVDARPRPAPVRDRGQDATTTPTRSMACRRARSPIPASRRCKAVANPAEPRLPLLRRQGRHARPMATSLPRPMPSTQNVARYRQNAASRGRGRGRARRSKALRPTGRAGDDQRRHAQ